jgi:flagellar hook assembly protein FlgD
VEAAVVDVRGRRVKTLHSGFREAGTTRLQWDGFDTAGRRAAAGVYFLRVVSREFREARRVVLLP